MQKSEREIVFIKVQQLYPHPDNPRKNVGDVSELAESIKKNGIMQNLTVIPLSALDEEVAKQSPADEISLLSDFVVLIGHRRLVACKKAGVQEVPCKIVSNISKKEQVGIMLEENMQRNDLTIYEQAQGFQMMLDLGETAESIAEKTGFSQSTVYHRLNIAKLNQKELQKKENDGGFQLTLQDLYELEKIKNVKTRNKVLKEATTSRDLAQRARNAARDEKREIALKEVLKQLKAAGVELILKENENIWWSNNYERVKEFDLDKEKKVSLKGKGPFFYECNYGTLRVVKKAEKKEKKKTPTEILWEQREKNKKKMKAIIKNMDKRRRQFVLDIISGEIKPVKNEVELKEIIWQFLLRECVYLSETSFVYFYTEKEAHKCTKEEKEEAETWAKSLSVLHQMIVLLCRLMNDKEFCNYDSSYCEAALKRWEPVYDIFVRYGWYFTEEEQQLLDGTHELYERKSEN